MPDPLQDCGDHIGTIKVEQSMSFKLKILACAGASLGACATVEALPTAVSPGLTWRLTSLTGGAQVELFEPDGRRSAVLRCQSGILSANIPSVKSVQGQPRTPAYLHLGGAPIALDPSDRGFTATAAIPSNIAERILSANEFRFTLGGQVFGPYIPPTGTEAQAFADACTKVALGR